MITFNKYHGAIYFILIALVNISFINGTLRILKNNYYESVIILYFYRYFRFILNRKNIIFDYFYRIML